MKKQFKGYKLTDFKGEINYSPVGKLINVIPSCLDPSVIVKTFQKTVPIQIFDTKCLRELADNYPIEMDFYPSD